MATLDDVVVTSTEFTSLNVAAGVAVGQPFEIQLKSISPVNLQEGSKPSDDSKRGVVISTKGNDIRLSRIPSESEEIWARCLADGTTATLAITEL